MKAKQNQKVPVTSRALIQRINRRLKPDGEMLKRSRGALAEGELGEYYTVDFERNVLGYTRINLEKYGRELGVLADFESLEDES